MSGKRHLQYLIEEYWALEQPIAIYDQFEDIQVIDNEVAIFIESAPAQNEILELAGRYYKVIETYVIGLVSNSADKNFEAVNEVKRILGEHYKNSTSDYTPYKYKHILANQEETSLLNAKSQKASP